MYRFGTLGFLATFLASCVETATTASIQDTIAVIDQLKISPEKTATYCSAIANKEHQEQCFLMGLDLLSDYPTQQMEQLCHQLPIALQEECFFRLAERSLSIDHCSQTAVLKDRCLMHLLQKRITEEEIRSFAEGEAVAEKHGLPLHRGTHNVIYHYILSRDKIVYINQCALERYPQACEEAAITLYLRRLRDLETNASDSCSAITEFPHFEHARLKKEQQYFQKRVCGKQVAD